MELIKAKDIGLLNKSTITSLELLEQINFFRKEEGKQTELRHDTLLNIIRDEFDEEIRDQKILESFYKKETGNGTIREYLMYILTFSQARQVLSRESKVVRRAIFKYLDELENKVNEKIILKANLLSDDKDIVIASHKRLVELETMENKKQIEQQQREIEHNQDVIIGLVKDIDLKDKRAILNDVVRYKGGQQAHERWKILYREFGSKYHIDINKRYENYKATHKEKTTYNKLDFIEKELKSLNELYEIACRLFKSDIDEIIARYKNIL